MSKISEYPIVNDALAIRRQIETTRNIETLRRNCRKLEAMIGVMTAPAYREYLDIIDNASA